jgi:hypothetical protein
MHVLFVRAVAGCGDRPEDEGNARQGESGYRGQYEFSHRGTFQDKPSPARNLSGAHYKQVTTA